MVTNPAPDQKPAGPDQKHAAPGERRPVAMTPYAIAVALFAAFVVGGILAKAVPLWRPLGRSQAGENSPGTRGR